MNWLTLLLVFLSCAYGRKVLGQRNAIADQRFYAPMYEYRIIDSRSPSEVIANEPNGIERILSGDPTRWVGKFDVESIFDFMPENPVYRAYLELYVSSSRNLKLTVAKPALGGLGLSNTTWDCPADDNLRDGISICSDPSNRFPGLPYVDFGHTFDVKRNDPGIKQFDITELVRTGAGALLLKLTDEKLYQNERADDFIAVHVNEFTPRVVFHQPKGNVILSDSEKHPGSKSKYVTINFRGQPVTHHMFVWDAQNPFPQEDCNILLPLGVFFTAQVGFGQGEIINNRCNVIQFSQHCTGLSSCYNDGENDLNIRAEIFTQAFWLHPQGLKLSKGTYFYDNDQGSSLIVHTIGWMKKQDLLFGTDYRTYLAAEAGYDASWALGAWCRPDLWAAGKCSRAFFNRATSLLPTGFMQFALCSQHGDVSNRNTNTSCRALLHEKHEFWAGWSLANPFDGSAAEAEVRQKFPWLSSVEYDPYQAGVFAWFGFENLVGPTPLVPGELTYHNSWTKPSRPNFMSQRYAMSLYPRNIITPAEDNECGPNSVLNPSCDQFVFGGIDINARLGQPTNVSSQRETWELEAYFAKHFLEATGHPLDSHFFAIHKPGLQDDYGWDPSDGVQCLPGQGGPLTVNGSCTGYGGQCVCGHGLVGNLGINTSPENIQARLDAMRTYHDASRIFSPLQCHQDLRCTDNVLHAAKIFENIHGIRERYHQKLANGW